MKETVCFMLSFSGSNIDPYKIFENDSLYGAEYAVYETAYRLTADYNVYITLNQPSGLYIRHREINWMSECDFYRWSELVQPDHLVVVRHTSPFVRTNLKHVRNVYMWLHDLLPLFVDPIINIPMEIVNCTNRICKNYISVGNQAITDYYVPKWRMDNDLFVVIKNGITLEREWSLQKVLASTRVKKSFVFSSSEGKGLWNLLNYWPTILKMWPDATLHIAYKYDNPKIFERINNDPSIHYYGKLKQHDLFGLYKQVEYWFFPNADHETCCTTAFETAYYGPIQITNTNGALVENVSGCKIPDGPQFYSVALDGLQFLEENPSIKESIRTRQYNFSLNHTWDHRIPLWKEMFSSE